MLSASLGGYFYSDTTLDDTTQPYVLTDDVVISSGATLSIMPGVEIISNDPEFELRGFIGYAGWSEGQLEDELQMESWVLTKLSTKLSNLDKPNIWHALLASQSPKMRLLSGEPPDPSLN